MSASPCGCDPDVAGEPYFCERHRGPDRYTIKEKWSHINQQGLPVNRAQALPNPSRCTTLPSDSQERKKYPIGTGVLDYFPDAIAAIARVSWQGNQQHNPGQPLHWAREKSTDQEDTMLRHYVERGTLDIDGQRHTAKMAWRALAILQLEIESDAQRERKERG